MKSTCWKTDWVDISATAGDYGIRLAVSLFVLASKATSFVCLRTAVAGNTHIYKHKTDQKRKRTSRGSTVIRTYLYFRRLSRRHASVNCKPLSFSADGRGAVSGTACPKTCSDSATTCEPRQIREWGTQAKSGGQAPPDTLRQCITDEDHCSV